MDPLHLSEQLQNSLRMAALIQEGFSRMSLFQQYSATLPMICLQLSDPLPIWYHKMAKETDLNQ